MGVPDHRPQKNSLDNVFLVLGLFYSLQRWSNGFIAERTILSKGSRGGPTFSSGVQLFPGGGGGRGDPNANFYINPYNL